jgi:chemotaxis protein MotB
VAMEDAATKKNSDIRAPAWVMTFADLMSLLMCFFVLLLSFSEMDVAKYKQIAGSMARAFGVQNKHKVKEPPKGISIIARDFSAGRPDPTPFHIMEQISSDQFKRHLKMGDKGTNSTEDKGSRQGEKGDKRSAGILTAPFKDDLFKTLKAREAEAKRKQLERNAKRIRAALRWEIMDGNVEVETQSQKIIIRIREKASFPSGRAELRDEFRPILGRIGEILADAGGKVVVAGHTDNVPIATERYRSNWELSASRAVSVVDALMDMSELGAGRLAIEGHAETQPRVSNDTAENRAKNRRVEIILIQGDDLETDRKLSVIPPVSEGQDGVQAPAGGNKETGAGDDR